MTSYSEDDFATFFQVTEPRLRRALVAAYGSERGREAAAEALVYAWENWESVRLMDHPLGYLYRVGQSRTRPRRSRAVFIRPQQSEAWFEPNLIGALERLTEAQRSAVLLVHGFGWTMKEMADCLDIKVTSVQNHLERGLRKLRTELKVSTDARTL